MQVLIRILIILSCKLVTWHADLQWFHYSLLCLFMNAVIHQPWSWTTSIRRTTTRPGIICIAQLPDTPISFWFITISCGNWVYDDEKHYPSNKLLSCNILPSFMEVLSWRWTRVENVGYWWFLSIFWGLWESDAYQFFRKARSLVMSLISWQDTHRSSMDDEQQQAS